MVMLIVIPFRSEDMSKLKFMIFWQPFWIYTNDYKVVMSYMLNQFLAQLILFILSTNPYLKI